MSRFLKGLKNLFGSGGWGKKGRFVELETRLDYRFESEALLREALTHSSVLGELRPEEADVTYERLEFLGDSVLALITSDFLIRNFPEENEGQLTKKKSLLVSKNVLTKKAIEIGIKDHIIMSENALRGGVADQDSVQTAALEAIIGAIYLDGGIVAARMFIEDNILDDIDVIIEHTDHINYKSLLQEWTQSNYRTYPQYRIKSTTGPEHDKSFLVEVRIGGRTIGRGRGKSKKDAEQLAAKEALSLVRKNH